MIINHKHKYIFIHIPKAAGTSITQALYPFSGSYDLFLGCGCGEESLTKKDGFKLHKHSPAQDVKIYATPERWNEYFVFTFVRHPIDRTISLYEWWQQTNGNWDREAKEEICKMTFKEFVFSKYVGKPQIDFLTSRGKDKKHFIEEQNFLEIDYIGKYNTIHKDFAYICGLLGLPQINLPHVNKSDYRNANVESYLDNEIIAEIERKFIKDYRAFPFF